MTGAFCTRGAYGPLCALCEREYYLREASQACESCSVSRAMWWIAPLACGLSFSAIGLVLWCARDYLLTTYLELKSRYGADSLQDRISEVFTRGTVVYITIQILVLLQENRAGLHDGGNEVPAPFKGLLSSFSFVALDFMQWIPTTCLGNRLDHLDTLICVTLIPVALLLVIAPLASLRSRQLRNYENNTFETYFTYHM